MIPWLLRTIFFLVVLLVFAHEGQASSELRNQDDAKVDCPVGFFAIGTSCYFFSGDNTSLFYDASDICRSLLPEGDLGSVDLAGLGDGDEEFSYVSDFVLSVGVERMFVGLTGPYDSDDWYWWDGSTLPLYSSMWSCIDPVFSCGGLIIDRYELAPRVYISSFDSQTTYASFLCEYTPSTDKKSVLPQRKVYD